MARRSRTASTTGRAGQRRGGARRASPDDRKAGGQNQRPVDDFADAMFDPSVLLDRTHPLRRVTALLLLQALEWQSAVLDVYRRALAEGAFDAPVEDQMRKVARNMMSAYLEVLKSLPERRERLMAQHAELIKTLSETVEDLRQRVADPGP